MSTENPIARHERDSGCENQIIPDLIGILPSQFYVKRLLDTDCGNGAITTAVGQKVRASVVHGLETNDAERLVATERFSRFEEGRVFPQEFQDFKSDALYDLIMLIDAVEKSPNPVQMLQKASRIALYVLIRFSRVMDANVLKNIKSSLDVGDFDVIDSRLIQAPLATVTLCKSKNYRLLNASLEKHLLEVIQDEIGAENLESVGIFGSYTTEKQKHSSDYDLVIIANHLADTHERESSSPRIKKKLIEQGIDGLFAFNFYSSAEFANADHADSWLVETMKNGFRILLDKNNVLLNILKKKKNNITQIDEFVWRGARDTSIDHLVEVQERYKQCEEIAKPIEQDIAQYDAVERRKIAVIRKLGEANIYATRSNYFELSKTYRSQTGEDVGLRQAQINSFNFEMESKRAMYRYDSTPQHQALSAALLERDLLLDALQHSYQALKIIYLEILHRRNFFIVDGEVTQAFLKKCLAELPADLIDRIYKCSFKAEQILGRSQIVSFDLDSNGNPIYQTSDASYLRPLIAQVDEITRHLSDLKPQLLKSVESDNPLVSIVIATLNREELVHQTIASMNHLIFPQQKVEIVVVDDGSAQPYDEAVLQEISTFTLRYIRKEHSGICATKNRGIQESKGEFVAFIDDDEVPSPLWLLHVMSGFTSESVAGVGSTLYSLPVANYLSDYADYRELGRRPFRDKTGQIVNLLTGNACLRKSVLAEVGGFNQSQSEAGIPFGGDDVDLTWKIRERGYSLGYADSASVFHRSRTSICSLIKQHIGYGEGTMYHCLTAKRPPSELGIPDPTIQACLKDVLSYTIFEVPKRFLQCFRDNLGLKKSITYPLIDLIRRTSYVWGILKTCLLISSSRSFHEETR